MEVDMSSVLSMRSVVSVRSVVVVVAACMALGGVGCEADEDTTRAEPVEDAARPAPDRSIPLDGTVADEGADGPMRDMAAGDMAAGDMAAADGMAADGMAADDMATDGMVVVDGMVADGMVAPDSGACAAAGESVPVVPGALPCCAGLAAFPCDRPDANGVCPGGCAGAVVCAACGDGVCGAGENACNCALDCGAACGSTAECVGRPAPIRCVGVWRCDPDASYPADSRGVDGCDYTCLGTLPACNADGDCAPPDVCLPCPVVDGCGGQSGVCGDGANVR